MSATCELFDSFGTQYGTILAEMKPTNGRRTDIGNDVVMDCTRRTIVRGMAGATLCAFSSAKSIASGSTRRLAITNVRVYPSPFQPPIANATIMIEGEHIAEVRSGTGVPRRSDWTLIDGAGGTVTAGLWNCHVHLTTPLLLQSGEASDAAVENELRRAFTQWGFTTVVDLASTMKIATALQARIAAGRIRGPRVLTAGDPFYPPDATPIYALPFYKEFGLPSAEVASGHEAEERATRQLSTGANAVKIFTGSIQGGEGEVSHMPAEIIRAISRTGRRRGIPVFAHPTDQRGLELAVQNGVNVLAHATPLMGRWSAEYAHWIARRGVAMVPTLSLFEVSRHPATPVDVAVDQARQLHRAGGRILFGTDAGFTEAFDTVRELRLMVSAIGWKGTLHALTTAPAELFGEGGKRGRVEPGYLADLVLLRGDPAVDVSNLANVAAVVRNGEILYRS